MRLLLAALALVAALASPANAAINARALTRGGGGDVAAGEYSASASHTNLPGSAATISASMESGTGSTDALLRAYVSNETMGGINNQVVAEALGIYQDTLYVGGGPGLATIRIGLTVSADFSIPTLYPQYGIDTSQYGTGRVALDFAAGPVFGDAQFNPLGNPQYATSAAVSVSDDITQPGIQRLTTTSANPNQYGMWDDYEFTTDPFLTDVIHFNGTRYFDVAYDPNLGGYKFGAYLRLQAVSFFSHAIGDVSNTVSLLEVTDTSGQRLQDLGYTLSFESGMTFPDDTAAVPEPASLAIWGLLGAAVVGGGWRLRRRPRVA